MASILLISTDKNLYKEINNILPLNKHQLVLCDYNHVAAAIYKYNVKFLILDLDHCDDITLKMMKDLKEMEYIPSVGIYTPTDRSIIQKNDFTKFLVLREDIKLNLLNSLDSFIEFKDEYDFIKEGNEAIDLIGNEIDRLFKAGSYSVRSLFQNIFASNEFLHNKPSIILVFSMSNEKTSFEVYRNQQGRTLLDKKSVIVENELFISEGIPIGSEFYANSNIKQFSDIDNFKYLLRKTLASIVPNILNFTGFATTSTAVIALNYDKEVTRTDAKLIKALCINLNLIRSVYHKVHEVNEAFIYTIEALARAGEAADDDTGSHIKRVNKYSQFVAQALGLETSFVETISYSAQMHDVGKIHIPQSILKKDGPLTQAEFQTMKEHTLYGPRIIGGSPHLHMAAEIALYHHEKYDGSGYPFGISGETIPLSARIVTLADVYDALRNPRVYKPAFTHERAVEIITVGDGRVMPSHFDPAILRVFLTHHQEFDKIWSES